MKHRNGVLFTVRDRLRHIVGEARVSAERKDWKTNHRLCREHDDLALSSFVVLIGSKEPSR